MFNLGTIIVAITIVWINNSTTELVKANGSEIGNPNNVTKGRKDGHRPVSVDKLEDRVEADDGDGRETEVDINTKLNLTSSRRQKPPWLNFAVGPLGATKPAEDTWLILPDFEQLQQYQEITNKKASKKFAAYENPELLAAIEKLLDTKHPLKRRPTKFRPSRRPTKQPRHTTKKPKDTKEPNDRTNGDSDKDSYIEFEVSIQKKNDEEDSVERLQNTHHNIHLPKKQLSSYGNKNHIIYAIKERQNKKMPIDKRGSKGFYNRPWWYRQHPYLRPRIPTLKD